MFVTCRIMLLKINAKNRNYSALRVKSDIIDRHHHHIINIPAEGGGKKAQYFKQT